MKATKFFAALMLVATVGLVGCKEKNPPLPTDQKTEQTDPGKTDDPSNPSDPAAPSTEGSVAAAIANNSGTGTVEGYIVGWYNNHKNAKRVEFNATATADTTVNAANICIADDPEETDQSKVLCVQLTAGPIRSAINLKENPTNLKKKVQLTGKLEKYNGLPGLKDPTAALLEGKDVTQVTAFCCYRVSIGDLSKDEASAMKVGDKVVVQSRILNYKGTTPETLWENGGYKGKILSINGTTPDNALTAQEAIEKAREIGTNASADEFVIAGTVSKIGEKFDEKYGNITFDME